MSFHIIIANPTELDGGLLQVSIVYTFDPAPDEALPDVLGFVMARITDVRDADIDPNELDKWAECWLHHNGYEQAVAFARRDNRTPARRTAYGTT